MMKYKVYIPHILSLDGSGPLYERRESAASILGRIEKPRPVKTSPLG